MTNILEISKKIKLVLLVGAPRTSTSFLYNVLRRQKDYIVPDEKELKFFNESILKDPLEKYLEKLLKNIKFQPEKIYCDFTPTYCILPYSCLKYIKEIFPHSKAIFIVRDPIRRTWSNITYDICLRHELRSINTFQKVRFYENPRIIKYNDYEHILHRWGSVYKNDFKVLIFEKIADDPNSALLEIGTFLGKSDISINIDSDLFMPAHGGKHSSSFTLEPAFFDKWYLYNNNKKCLEYLSREFAKENVIKDYCDIYKNEMNKVSIKKSWIIYRCFYKYIISIPVKITSCLLNFTRFILIKYKLQSILKSKKNWLIDAVSGGFHALMIRQISRR